MTFIVSNIDIQPLLDASESFFQALEEVTSDLTRDGAIQRFEYTFELSWKTMRRLLREKGSEVNHPKDVFREAAAEKMITDPLRWFVHLEKRNKTTHIYKREVAEEVFSDLPEFKDDVQAFIHYLKSLKP